MKDGFKDTIGKRIPAEPISELLGKDLEAWRIAKAAIEKARRAQIPG
jgi:hypothetical protein